MRRTSLRLLGFFAFGAAPFAFQAVIRPVAILPASSTGAEMVDTTLVLELMAFSAR